MIVMVSVSVAFGSLVLCSWWMGTLSTNLLTERFGDLEAQRAVTDIKNAKSPPVIFLSVFMACVAAPIVEELLFRGWMLYWFAGDAANADLGSFELVLAVVGSSIAFGLMHPITKLYVALAALIGVYFGVLLLLSGNLLIPIAAHATYDAVQLIITGRQQQTATS